MNLIRVLPILCLTAPLIAQVPAINRTTQLKRTPQIRNAQAFSVLPQVADGGVWSTQIVIVNLNPNSAEQFEVDFYDSNGNSTTVPIVGLGDVPYLRAGLNPGQTITYVTPGTATTETDTWATTRNESTGADISVFENLRDTIPSENYFAETSISCDFGVDNTATNPGGFLPFDNTNGAVTALALVNPDFGNTTGGSTSILVQVLDSAGVSIGQHTVTLTGGKHTAFLVPTEWPEATNMQGTLYILPSTGTFSPITIFGLSSYFNAHYKTISTINLLQPTVGSTVP